MTGRLISRTIAWAVAMAGGCTLLGAGSAAAGTLTLNFNALTNGGLLSGCNLWTVTPYSGPGQGEFGYTTPCNGHPMQMWFEPLPGTPTPPAGARASFQIAAPAGVTITSATVTAATIQNINNGQGWGGGSFYQSGGGLWHNGETYEHDGPISSSYWGFAMICGWSSCTKVGGIYPSTISLTATENTGPSLTAIGGNNLWYQAAHWVWNPPGDAFPLTLDSQDVSGVCSITAYVGSQQPLNAPRPYQLNTLWQQCEERTGSNEWAPTVDTSSLVPGAGSLPLSIYATNAAGVTSGVNETLSVDNAPVTVSISTPNDADPNAWVGHAVTVASSVSTGPS
ncbi:MAG: hypothetical protein M3076_19780, partial [Actinomycetota bacterium]|nr:hypothetical protein [Actinomycetota bacterium]